MQTENRKRNRINNLQRIVDTYRANMRKWKKSMDMHDDPVMKQFYKDMLLSSLKQWRSACRILRREQKGLVDFG